MKVKFVPKNARKLPGNVKFIRMYPESQKPLLSAPVTYEEAQKKAQILIYLKQGRNLLNKSAFPLTPPLPQSREVC